WEVLSVLRKDNPGKICSRPIGIEVKTLSGLTVSQTGDQIYRQDTTTGFVCRNDDQPFMRMCSDYRVRFNCFPSFCGGEVCWTKWYNRDRPSGSGDWELLSNLREQYPGQICAKPLKLEVVTTDTMTPASSTGEIFFLNNPTQGFVCKNSDQKDGRCKDYQVRFGCPC
uniref:WxxW domain-containing protein n=1 Tax=Salarias fasciatus TaxID=181472 RepID=A0A672II87_SALFA